MLSNFNVRKENVFVEKIEFLNSTEDKVLAIIKLLTVKCINLFHTYTTCPKLDCGDFHSHIDQLGLALEPNLMRLPVTLEAD